MCKLLTSIVKTNPNETYIILSIFNALCPALRLDMVLGVRLN